MNPEEEVRQCAQCGAAAAVCIRHWKRERFGHDSGFGDRDFCCQACGHRFTLVSKVYIGSFIALALILAIAVFPFFLFGGWAAYRTWPWLRNPLVPGAPMPPMRYRAVEPTRACACGGAAVCRSVTRHSTNFIPTGTVYVYACTRCSASFTLSNPYGILFGLMAGGFLVMIGAVLAAALFGIPILIGGLVYWGLMAYRVVTALRHPVIGDAV